MTEEEYRRACAESEKLKGPEIPNAKVDKDGWFTVKRKGVEFYESAPLIHTGAHPVEEVIPWLWPGRISLGMVTFIEGASNIGKTSLVMYLAARVSRGWSWPKEGSPTPEAGSSKEPPAEGSEKPAPVAGADQPLSAKDSQNLTPANPSPSSAPSPNPASQLPPSNPNPNLHSSFRLPPSAFMFEPPNAGDVLLLSGDPDGWERVLLPRLRVIGADSYRVHRMEYIDCEDSRISAKCTGRSQRKISFPQDLMMLEQNIRAWPATKLVIIDTLSTFCADDRAYRAALRELDEIAVRRNVAIVVTDRPKGRTPKKQTDEADRRVDSVRSVFRVLVDPEDETVRFLAPVRMSFCVPPPWLPFRLQSRGPNELGIGSGAAVGWGPAVAEPSEWLAPPHKAKEKDALKRSVMEWLRVMLIKSDMPSQTVCREAKRCGYSEATLRRARQELGVRPFRGPGGPNGVSWWTLRPTEKPAPDPEVEMSQIENWESDSPGYVVPPNDPEGPQKSHGRRASEHLLGLNGRRKKARKVRPGEEGVSPELAEAAERVREELRAEREAADKLYQAGAAPGEAAKERQPPQPPSGKKAEPHGEDLLGILQAIRQDFEAERRVFDKWDQEDEEKKAAEGKEGGERKTAIK